MPLQSSVLRYGVVMTVHRVSISLAATVLLTACSATSGSELTLQEPRLGSVASEPIRPASEHVFKASEATTVPPARAKVAASSAGDGMRVREMANELTATARPGSRSYRVGPLDVVEISVFKVPELSKTIQVSEAGTVNYPLIGEVAAAGNTARS